MTTHTPGDAHEHHADMPHTAARIALVGLVVNGVLAVVKLLAGIIGHSGALVADAIESLADIAGSAVIWGGLRFGAVPPDEEHPYGHGKAESLASLVVACVMLAAAGGIIAKSIRDIREPHTPPEWWTLGVLVVVVIVKYGLYVRVRRAARREGSGALHVDAGHHVADAITSLAAGVGIAVALFGQRVFGPAAPGAMGWETADDWAALLAGGVIGYNAVTLALVPLRELMDTTTHEDRSRVIEPARVVAGKVPGVRAIEKVVARKSGRAYFLDMHVQVDGEMPVREGHAVGGRVRAAVKRGVPGVRDALIHIEPYEPHEAEREPAQARAAMQTTPEAGKSSGDSSGRGPDEASA